MEGYTDTILIDCNRSNSEEGKANNKEQYSQFTCKTGTGIKVNPGDQISVHSGFVSEVGCGQGVIELTGKNLITEYQVEQTVKDLGQKYWNISTDSVDQPYPPFRNLEPHGAGYVGFRNQSTTYQLKDNEIHLSLSYYKNTNGSGYIHLPRRFDADKTNFDPNDATETAPDWVNTLMPETANGPEDTYQHGRCMMFGRWGIQRLYSDLRYFKEGTAPVPLGPNYDSMRDETPNQDTSRLWKYKNDNSRYTLFVLADQYFGERTRNGYFIPDITKYKSTQNPFGDPENVDNTGPNRDIFAVNGDTDNARDPCLCEWIKYKEDKLISLETGFQAPQSIADNLTDQLNERSPTRTIIGQAGGKVPVRATPTTQTLRGMEQVEVSLESDSATYKGFGCATAFTFEKQNYVDYWSNLAVVSPAGFDTGVPGSVAVDDGLRVMDYMRNYQTIGVKRPDLWYTGREVLKKCQQISNNAGDDWVGVGDAPLKSWRNVQYPRMMNALSWANGRDGEIITQFEWTPENLDLLKAWFDAQAEDETLFNSTPANMVKNSDRFKYVGLNTKNARFIHMNIEDRVAPHETLGDDQYDATPGTYPTPNGSFTGQRQSAPLFIYHDEKAKDNAWGGDSVNDMYYGFALKRTIEKTEAGATFPFECIAFNTSEIGGIPAEFWTGGGPVPTPADDTFYINANKDGVVNYSRFCGPDPHFNAYGTDAIMLYAGYLNGNVNNRSFYNGSSTQILGPLTAWQQAQNIQKRLVGASAPAVVFDPDNSKFQFTSLHTPEYTGNRADAGGPDGSDVSTASGVPVWYLNKRIRRTDFTPDMMPYQIDLSSEPKGATPVKFSPMNWNIEPWKIFDADCGIFIDSFNVDELDWDRSMMGILGFSYNQFNSKNTADTRQTRINDNIVFDPSGSLTTNAVVNGSDIIQWRTNQFGANLYNNQLPIGMNDEDAKVGPAGARATVPYLPVVSEKQTSASIQAEHLARKMLTPYYLIRSDIVSDHKFQGGADGGEALPIVHIVNKENGFGDFFFQSESENTFTVTKSRVISEITTSIHNPDMTLASTTDGSGIIYKIQKNNQSDLDIASQVLNKNKKK